jgi:hypothetical protein
MCQVNKTPLVLDDGTLCRCASPLSGTIGAEPEVSDQFRWPLGVDSSKPLGEEAWFEQRYPELLEDARLTFVDVVDKWVQRNWGKSPFEDQKQRISVTARDTSYINPDRSYRTVKKNDNKFERCGDRPQTAHEADKVLGAFWLDIETPVLVSYSYRSIAGKVVVHFEWQAVMYVGDVLGLQEDNRVVQGLGKWTLELAPSRKVTRARWYISGEGLTYKVSKGDTLSGIATALTGDAGNWKAIHHMNRLEIPDPNRISPGQRILIPAAIMK